MASLRTNYHSRVIHIKQGNMGEGNLVAKAHGIKGYIIFSIINSPIKLLKIATNVCKL